MSKLMALVWCAAALVLAVLARPAAAAPKPQVLVDYGYPGYYAAAAAPSYVSAYSAPLAYSYPYAYTYSYPYTYY